jgi:AraC-like DNA-binding protein
MAQQNGRMSEAHEDANRRLLRARDAMDRGYAEPLNLDALAAVAFMAPTHFIREFKRVFAETPYRYLQRRRVERAMFLLRHSRRTVTDICANVGFTSLGTFSRTFTAIVGVTPTAYREASAPLRAPTSFAMRWTRPVG